MKKGRELSEQDNNFQFIRRLLRPQLLFGCFLYSIFSVIYIDVFAASSAGLVASLGLFGLVCFLAIWRPVYGVLAVMLLFFTVPWFPRDILSSYFDLQVSRERQFNTVASISFLGVPLLYLLSFFVVGTLFLRNIGVKAIGRRNLILFFFCFGLLCLNSVAYYWLGNDFDFAQFKEWAFYLLLIPVGYSFYYCLVSTYGINQSIEILSSFYLAVTLILAIRVPMFLLNDIYRGVFSLDLSIYPHLSMAVILGLVIAASRMRDTKSAIKTFCLIGILAFSILSPSRGFFVIFMASMGILTLASRDKLRVIKWQMILLVILSVPVMIVFVSNSELFEFFVWKAEILTAGDASDSGRLRWYEFTNILHAALNNPLFLLIGEGPSGHFTFSYEQPPPEIYQILDLDSYSAAELNSDKYYNPHFFINVLLLKFGIIGLVVYGYFIALHMVRAAKLIKGRLFKSATVQFYLVVNFVLCISMYFEMFWRPYYLLLFVLNFFLIGSMCKRGAINASP